MIALRPHHALCLHFFEGRGYSDGFVENMTKIKALLEESDPELMLVCECDEICAGCPHSSCGCCECDEKVSRYDSAVLRLLSLRDREVLRYSRLSSAAYDRIISPGRLGEVCSGCQWESLCAGKKIS